ncbi:MAG: hypothetical protein AAGI38_05760 [Bacteroidota bacterium]
MRTVIFSPLLILLFLLSNPLFAQYTYEVSTLLPQNSNLVDDGLCVDKNGNLYGSYWGVWPSAPGTHVFRYRPNGTYDTLATGFVHPNGMSFHKGKVLVADAGNGRIASIDTAGTVTTFATLSGISNVIPVPGTDSLIAVSWGRNRVFGVSPTGTVSVLSRSSLFNGPAGAAIDTLGRLYIANFNNGLITRITNGTVEVFADLGGGIGFITYSDGAILATNHLTKRVFRIPVNGLGTEIIAGNGDTLMVDGPGATASFLSPNGIVATSTGDTIYVSEGEGKALRRIIRKRVALNNQSLDNTVPRLPITYPIPTSGMIYFDQLEHSKVGLGIIQNMSGQVIHKIANTDFMQGQLDVSFLPNGLYELTVLTPAGEPYFQVRLPIIK